MYRRESIRADGADASRLFFTVDPNEIQFKQTNDQLNGAIDVVFVQETKRGKALTDLKKTLNLSATVDRFAAIRSKALTAGEDIALRPDTESVRIVVMDRSNGAIGSVTIPVTAQDRSGPTVIRNPNAGEHTNAAVRFFTEVYSSRTRVGTAKTLITLFFSCAF